MTPAARRFLPLATIVPMLLLASCQGSSGGSQVAPASSATAPSEASSAAVSRPAGTGEPEIRMISSFDLEVDDCWRVPMVEVDANDTVLMDCEQPHQYQVYYLTDYAGDKDEFPGKEAMESAADEACIGAFEDYVGIDYESSEFDYATLYPSEESWADGDRELLCSLAASDNSDWTGSAKGAAR